MQSDLTAASRRSRWRRGGAAAGTQTFSHRGQRNISHEAASHQHPPDAGHLQTHQLRFNIVSEEHLGNYTCVFENEAELDFILAVPQIGERREKPIVSYVGDFVVLTCKMEDNKPVPRTWNWFKNNGTDKEQLFEAQRYDITVNGRNTKLKVKDVSEANSGVYHCAAVYNISTSTSKMHLKVITIWEPLKPFLSILVEVVILVTAILIYERSRSKKKEAEANGPNADPKNTQPQGEDEEAEESASVRQRKT
ncbi:embigin isoform X2 [Xiphophorus hellerii]|uniref:embigin isoform X2 n=1 Tax=Xiphophorus hellerii TaxID=8084 RepID=UPI0013B45F12|nr:embigin isoform X2 [Xiphophorus hellerii]